MRILDLAVVTLAGVVFAVSAGKALYELWAEPETVTRYLLLTGVGILIADIIFFALWYWQIDRGGPAARALGIKPYPDIFFPQMSDPPISDPNWESQIGDYVYLSFTIAVGFGPADTIPLARHVKYAMLLQAASSLAIVAVVVSSAVSALA